MESLKEFLELRPLLPKSSFEMGLIESAFGAGSLSKLFSVSDRETLDAVAGACRPLCYPRSPGCLISPIC